MVVELEATSSDLSRHRVDVGSLYLQKTALAEILP